MAPHPGSTGAASIRRDSALRAHLLATAPDQNRSLAERDSSGLQERRVADGLSATRSVPDDQDEVSSSDAEEAPRPVGCGHGRERPGDILWPSRRRVSPVAAVVPGSGCGLARTVGAGSVVDVGAGQENSRSSWSRVVWRLMSSSRMSGCSPVSGAPIQPLGSTSQIRPTFRWRTRRWTRYWSRTPGIGSTQRTRFPEDEVEFKQIEWEWDVTPEHRAAFLATTSMAIAMTPDERTIAYERSRSALQEVCQARHRQAMPIRHTASCIRWTPMR